MQYYRLHSAGSGYPSVTDFCEYFNETWGSTNDEKFLKMINDYQLLKEDSDPFNQLSVNLFMR
jgi:hypothetical protein